jgi:hypothetical protein
MTAAARTITRSHRMAMAAAMVIAAPSVGAAATAIASAEPNHTFLQQYYAECVSHELALNQGELPQEAHESCCTDLGGTYNIKTDQCYLPDQTTADPGGQPTAPPPGATVILPPGSNTRAGIQ